MGYASIHGAHVTSNHSESSASDSPDPARTVAVGLRCAPASCLLPPVSFWCLLIFTAGAVAAQDKPYPIFTLDHLDATMRRLGANVAGLRASLADGDFTAAKARVIRSREQLAITVTFWRDKGRDDAVALLRTALDRMDALDAALSVEEVDPTAVETLVTQIGDACTACHAVYREQDPVTREYRLTPGALTDR